MSNQKQDSLFRLYFKLKMYKSSGMDFQIFFSNIMGYLDDNYVPIKPHGNWGDGGNDGCNQEEKHYYQLYSPIATTTSSPITEFNKAVTDYHKLLKKWGTVKGYSFVLNDKFTNVIAPLQNDFQKFKEDNKIIVGHIIHAQKLLGLFMKLDEGQRLDVLDMHCIDDNSNSGYEPSIIGELIVHLIENTDTSFNFLSGKAPDFDEKILFNKLSPYLSAKLTGNYSEVFKINEFLEVQDEGMSQDLSLSINEIYKEICASIPLDEEDRNELIYLSLIEMLIPQHANKNKLTKRGYTSVAEIIIAKYFSTCDVYEDPNSLIAS